MTPLGTIAAFALLLVRPGMLVIGTPLLGAVQAPAILRAGLIVLVAVLLAPSVALPTSPPWSNRTR